MRKIIAYLLTMLITAVPGYALTPDQVKTQALAAHNTYRAAHHVPALVWDESMARYAEKYASRCQFQHSSSAYGENLATGYPSIPAAIAVWYHENKFYSYRHPGYSSQTGHFTQLIWKATAKLGCAYVACDGKNGTPGNFLVCEYSPRGNVATRAYFQANVLPAK